MYPITIPKLVVRVEENITVRDIAREATPLWMGHHSFIFKYAYIVFVSAVSANWMALVSS